jgi:uncharacterized protein (DUF1330 family)
VSAVTLCVLLWAHPGQSAALTEYEDRVLKLVWEHDGQVLQRGRVIGGSAGAPDEIQVLGFASEAALDAYTQDPRRTAMAADRDAAIARTDVHRIDSVLSGRAFTDDKLARCD